MKKLGRRNYSLIISGVKSCGSYDPNEIFFVFEEELYTEEYDEIWKFLEWCHNNNKYFGHGNYEKRFTEFKNLSI